MDLGIETKPALIGKVLRSLIPRRFRQMLQSAPSVKMIWGSFIWLIITRETFIKFEIPKKYGRRSFPQPVG